MDIEGNPGDVCQDDTLVVFSELWNTWGVDQKLGTAFGERGTWNLGKLTVMDITNRAEPVAGNVRGW